ncbi:hypothetical protein WP50_32555 [Lactiplantibacillus plantarum]|nr:hypothetical protein WP50_32555 [Lactiplantibacillus plantarum]
MSSKHQLKFAKVKVYNDFILIGISLVLALSFTHSLAGVREGTLIAAFLSKCLRTNYNKFTSPYKRKEIEIVIEKIH